MGDRMDGGDRRKDGAVTPPPLPPKDPAKSAAVLRHKLERLISAETGLELEREDRVGNSLETSPRRSALPRMGTSLVSFRPQPPNTAPLPRKEVGMEEEMAASFTAGQKWTPSAFNRGGAFRSTLAVPSSTRSSTASLSTASLASRDMESQLSLCSVDSESSLSGRHRGKGVFARLQESTSVLSQRRKPKLRFISYQLSLCSVDSESSLSGRHRGKGVFARLQESTSVLSQRRKPKLRGMVMERKNDRCNEWLERLGSVEGHEKAVLAVAATTRTLLTGSKDQMAKVWDLERQAEALSLGPHPNNVTSVALSDERNLAFSVSMGNCRVWDLRTGKAVRSLCSSGAVQEEGPRSLINAILAPAGENLLLSAAGNTVRLWDLDRLESVGELAKATVSPSSDVLSMASFPSAHCHWIATGSRDRYIKLYRLRRDAPSWEVVEPWTTLEPPHYENVTALLAMDKPSAALREGQPHFSLFSASRDKNLMLWDAGSSGVSRVGMVAPAHKEAVLALATLPPPMDRIVASGGKDGILRLWSGENGDLTALGSVPAHKAPLNALIANNNLLFSASDDCKVGIWSMIRGGDEREAFI